jgi:hypothetical protein
VAPKSFNDVPNEVLQSILARVKNSGRLANIVPCLRVCHRWSEYGKSLAWRTLVLDKNKMDELIISTLQYNHPFCLVTALTICGGVPYPKMCFCECQEHDGVWSDGSNHQVRCLDDNSEIEDMGRAIERVLVLVRHKMTNLKTFSLHIDPDPEEVRGPFCGCYETIFTERLGQSIIRSLPPHCVNLEIDTGGEWIGCCSTSIRNRLQQLTHLRLRTSPLCWKLLSDDEPAAKDGLDEQSSEQCTKTQLLSNSLRSVMVSSIVYP